MGFSVDTAALAGLPKMLDRSGDDARATRAYLVKHADLGMGEGVFNFVLGGHRTATARVAGFLDRLDTAASGHAGRVQATIGHYKRTDLAVAAALDAALPAVPGAPWFRPEAGGRAGFADRVEPQDLLVPPRDYVGDYGFEMKWHSYLSPTSYARWLIWEVTSLATRLGICGKPIDIVADWLTPWLGDWAGFRACADVHEQIGRVSVAIGGNLEAGAVDTQSVWTGNAADACRRELSQTRLALMTAEDKLNVLADEYRRVAENTRKLAEAVSGLVVVAMDVAAMALFELQAAVATARTVVGGVVFGGLAAHHVWKIIEIGMKIFDCIKIAEYGAKAFSSAMDGFNVVDAGGPLPDLPVAGSTPPRYTAKQPI